MNRNYKRGDFLTGAAYAANGEPVDARSPPRRERDELRRQYPTFDNVLQQAGPSPAERKLAEVVAENRRIEERVAEIKKKVAAFRKATGRS